VNTLRSSKQTNTIKFNIKVVHAVNDCSSFSTKLVLGESLEHIVNTIFTNRKQFYVQHSQCKCTV